MFTYSDRDFMSNNMKIVVESIESKLREQFFLEFKEVAIVAISKSIEAIKMFESSGLHRDLSCFNDNQAEEVVNALFCEITDEIVDVQVFQVFDALRYSFVCYAYNGLHQLYTRQENECWHPQIVLTEVLEPNDIDSLPQVLTLYRGCDRSELENHSYGQAWSTSLESAKNFAYIHYLGQDWFDENNRVVLEATYLKEYVLFSDQSIEYEVVVDVNKLDGVRKYA